MDAYIDQYTDFMTRICHRSENTVESYRRDVLQYLTYLKELGITSIKKTTKTTVLSPAKYQYLCFKNSVLNT